MLIVCAGLDHARRGYESFARECFEALSSEPEIHLELAKSSGTAAPREHVARTLRRDRGPALALGRGLGVRPFRLEALAFAVSLQPVLVRERPDLVYLSEWDTAWALARLRRVTRLHFRLLLCNGGFASSGFEHLDHVQELTPAARDHVLSHGGDPLRHTVLPLGFEIEPALTSTSPTERAALRDALGLPQRRPIVLSVAALNSSHKRLDYLIEELAAMPRPRPYLLLCGEPDGETPAVRALGLERLGEGEIELRTVPPAQMADIYRASDVLAHASVSEAQGRVLVEALAHGLPCVAHDSPVMRFALGENALLDDFTKIGSLTRLLEEHFAADPSLSRDRVQAGHAHVYRRFSWDRLRPRYVELLARVAEANSTVSASTAENVSR